MRTSAAAILFPLLVLALFPARAGRAADAGPAHDINPARRPLLALRLRDPARAAAIRGTKAARLAGLSDFDFSGRPPGIALDIASANRFLAALAQSGASDFRFCLLQTGESLASLSSALAWTMPLPAPPAGKPEADALGPWLRAAGADPHAAMLGVTRREGNAAAILIARDADALKAATAGGTGDDDGDWRAAFAAFLADAGPDAGVWLNPRPLWGMATLFAGIDPRRLAAESGMNLPSSMAVDLVDNAGDLGFVLRLADMAPGAAPTPDEPDMRPAFDPAPAGIAALSFAPVAARFSAAETNPLFPANLNLPELLPRSLALGWERGETGRPDWNAWLAAAALGDNPAAANQYRRVFAWLRALSRPPASYLETGPIRVDGDGIEALRVSFGGRTVHLALAERDAGSGKNNAFVLAAASEDGLRSASRGLATERMPGGYAAIWDVELDDSSRRFLAEAFAGFLDRAGHGVGVEEVFDALPAGERGGIRMENGAVTLESPHGLAAWAVPALAFLPRRVMDGMGAGTHSERTAAARLRFLLDAAQQSRFRFVNADDFTPAPLPAALDELPFADRDGALWLDRSFPAFPGAGGNVADHLADMAAGRPLDGYVYAIRPDDWRMEARNGDGTRLVIRADGTLFRAAPGTDDWETVSP